MLELFDHLKVQLFKRVDVVNMMIMNAEMMKNLMQDLLDLA